MKVFTISKQAFQQNKKRLDGLIFWREADGLIEFKFASKKFENYFTKP